MLENTDEFHVTAPPTAAWHKTLTHSHMACGYGLIRFKWQSHNTNKWQSYDTDEWQSRDTDEWQSRDTDELQSRDTD